MRLIKKILKSIIKTLKINKVIYYFLKPFNSKKTLMTRDIALTILQDFSKCPTGLPRANNEIVSNEYDLQIIIPVYNGEKYLEECLESVVNQKTKYKFKVVIINDGSIDSTTEILCRYKNINNVEIIEQENRGFSGARNRGLKQINAKYIMFVDADDILEEDAIDKLLTYAFNKKVDIVQGAYYQIYNNKFNYRNPKTLVGFPWGKVINSKLFSTICFPEGFWYEDTIFSFLIYSQNISSLIIEDVVYFYRLNPNGISSTSKKNKKCIDAYWIVKMLVDEYIYINLSINHEFFKKIMQHILLCFERTKEMPIIIQEAIFVLWYDILQNFNAKDICKEYNALYNFIMKKNFGLYKLYCLTHYL